MPTASEPKYLPGQVVRHIRNPETAYVVVGVLYAYVVKPASETDDSRFVVLEGGLLPDTDAELESYHAVPRQAGTQRDGNT